MPEIDDSARCPCNTGLAFGECCGPFLAANTLAPTAERLMRSRYTAYVIGEFDYLRATWHPTTRPATLELDADIRWTGLEILGRTRGGLLDDEGTVDFRATYRRDGLRLRQQENSRFIRENRAWYYLSGIVRSDDSVRAE